MAFQKGKSGNPKGKPLGSKNKVTSDLRVAITNFLESNFEDVLEDYLKLSPRDRCKFYSELLQYSLPKLQSTKIDATLSPESDVSKIVFSLKRRGE